MTADQRKQSFFFFALMAVMQCVPQFVDMTRKRSNLNPAPILEQFCDILEMVSSKFRTGLLSTRCFLICFFSSANSQNFEIDGPSLGTWA